MVVTGDRDLFQLIEPGVRVMATSRGITETKVYDRDAVIDRYGIAPELIPDFVGLKGDTSDNIPGVPGIGEKTASQLLQEHGSLEGVLGQHRQHLRRQAQGEPDEPRRGRARVEDARHRHPRHRPRRDRPRPHRRARARPLAAARDVPRVRAARAARAARGGARRGRGRRARRAGRGGRAHEGARPCRWPRSARSRASWWRWRTSARARPASRTARRRSTWAGRRWGRWRWRPTRAARCWSPSTRPSPP